MKPKDSHVDSFWQLVISVKRGRLRHDRATSGGSRSLPRLGGFRDDIRDGGGSTGKAQKHDSWNVRKCKALVVKNTIEGQLNK